MQAKSRATNNFKQFSKFQLVVNLRTFTLIVWCI